MPLLSRAQRTFFEQAATRYHADLSVDVAAQRYLATRGLGRDAAGLFRLGVVRNPLVGHEQFRNRLAIPYMTVPTASGRGGGVVNFNFRCIQDHGGADCKELGHKKYLRMTGVDLGMYNVADTRKPGPAIVLAEGELDTISWSMSGVPSAGLPGVDSWKPHYGRLLDDFQEVYTAADPDEAGGKMASFLAKEVRARRLHFERGDDSNKVYAREGKDGLLRLLKREDE